MMRKLSISFLCSMLLLVGFNPYIQAHYAAKRPTTPDPSLGRVHEFNMRGKIVYLNYREHLITFWTFEVASLLGLIGGGLWVLADRRDGSKRCTSNSEGG